MSAKAPELEGHAGWLNTDRHLSLRELRGKIVLLDFWTYCCINCMHVLPDLKRLEAKYPNELVVIGVHSAKFSNEQGTEQIRQAILRYGVTHPVVNDREFRVWQRYGVTSWPTLILIDPDGNLVGRLSGEGHYEALDAAIGRLADESRRLGKLDERPLAAHQEPARVGSHGLAFPGKITTDGQRLFIADSNHNRVVVADLSGAVLDLIGSGEEGARDGPFERAAFKNPQGMAVEGELLYIADTENHLLRRADLKRREVQTIAGTGRQARSPIAGGKALRTALSSPWDVAWLGGDLYVAMAGLHQLWKLDVKAGTIAPFAGSGEEHIVDGPRRSAALAQPSGITTDGKVLYVADSEVSGVRVVEPGDDGWVRTLIGQGLFQFGDVDGVGAAARLQHPLGVTFHGGRVYVADTYNHKIKRIDPLTKRCETAWGAGRAGSVDGPTPQFDEPGGLAFAGDRLYVADTNNHAIRVVEPDTGRTRTLTLRGLTPPPTTNRGISVD
ncbi:MAG: redoxin domain-containing protein [Candidatus Omnitrophica bacterium]|nr:redoxin domain-containing protein [Candidatus Omnitrophota bacterium]